MPGISFSIYAIASSAFLAETSGDNGFWMFTAIGVVFLFVALYLRHERTKAPESTTEQGDEGAGASGAQPAPDTRPSTRSATFEPPYAD